MAAKEKIIEIQSLQSQLASLKPHARIEALRTITIIMNAAKKYQNTEDDIVLKFHLQNQTLKAERRQRLLRECDSAKEAAKHLNCDLNALRVWISRGRLLALKDGHKNLIPRWQYDASSPSGLIPGLDIVLHALKGLGTREAKAEWLRNLDLGEGLSPIEALKSGKYSVDHIRSLALSDALLADRRPEDEE